ncbi:MAG: hypothetical protein HY748_09555 [Elusimicrobia bacterium]|nr:hypothetical protein [Elusimicrobiota bacterium]
MSGQSGPVTSGGSSSRGGSGGEVGVPRGAAEPRKAADESSKKASEGKPPERPAAPDLLSSALEPVDAATFKPKVIKRPEALVSLYFPGCSDCDLVAPVLKTLSGDLKGKVDFYRMDTSVPENLALLPRGFTVRAYPSFLLYREGSVVSWKQGLPFESREAAGESPAETTEEYQGRLSQWFKDSLARGTLAGSP